MSVLSKLSEREHQTAALVAQGLSNSQIAKKLAVTENTVKTTVRRVFQKSGCASRGELAAAVVGALPDSERDRLRSTSRVQEFLGKYARLAGRDKAILALLAANPTSSNSQLATLCAAADYPMTLGALRERLRDLFVLFGATRTALVTLWLLGHDLAPSAVEDAANAKPATMPDVAQG